jgi:hypothetical protein
MTLLDIIETYNTRYGYELDDLGSIFRDIDIDARLDKDVLIGALLDECGAMDAIYTTTSTFKFFSDNFFKKYKWNIEKLINTLEFEYNPIENRKLDWTETTDIEQNLDTGETQSEEKVRTNTGTQTREDTGTQTNKDTGTQTNENTGTQTMANTGTQDNEYDETETNTISAMNSNDYQPDNKKETTGSNTRTDDLLSTRTDNLTGTRTDDLTSTRTDDLTKTRTDNLEENINATNSRDKSEDLTWAETDTHTEHGTNNVLYQDLIEKERKISQFSIYGWISRKYAKELFLLVY